MAQPLLTPLHELTAAYREAGAKAEDLVAALVGGDFTVVQAAVAAQTHAVERIARMEGQWVAARDRLAATLREEGMALAEGDALTIGALVAVLPPADAAALRSVRHELLTALMRLQALNRQAGVLLRNAQGVIRRAVRASAGGLGGYGPTGQYTVESRTLKVERKARSTFDRRPSTVDSVRRA